MNVVERILSKVVGQDITMDELNAVSGGLQDHCSSIPDSYATADQYGTNPKCDFP